ncbi:MAG: elongation factor G, partial [Cytophagales bacterium]
NVIEEIQSELGVEPLLIQIPIGTESNFRGVVDLVSYKAILWGDEDKGKTATVTDIPEEMLAEAENYRHHLLERISLESEALFEKFSQNPDDITQEEIIQAIRKGTITKSFVPIMLGSSLKNKGVQPLIDAIAHYLPSPLDMPDIVGSDPKKGDEVVRKQDPSEPFCALCFKTINDPHGQLTFMRIYSGTLHVGDTVYNPRTRKTGRMPSIVQIHSDKRTPIEKALAGTIVGVKGLKNAITGDTICDEKYPIVLQKMEFPEPVIGIRIEPKKQSDIKALGIALQRAIQADPSLKYVVDPESGETILKGMGELHLQVSLEEILRRDKIEVNQGDPQVAYREALNKTIEFRYIHKKQTGGRGQYADIKCKIGPITETDEEDNLLKGFVFINNIKGGNIPREFIPSVKKGFEEAMQTGPLKGYPLDSMQITLEDGSYHDVDSSQQAFETAAKSGYNKFAKDAHPILLEPIMLVEINVPSNYAGQVTGDLNGRRGQIMSMVSKGNGENIKATVPLGELNKYDSALRALTSGQAVASISFSSYKQVPPHILEGI